MNEALIQQFLRALLSGFVSNPQDIVSIDNYASDKSAAWNYTNNFESKRYELIFGKKANELSSNLQKTLINDIYAAIGFNDNATALDTNFKKVKSWVEDKGMSLVMPQLMNGVNDIYNAAFAMRSAYHKDGDSNYSLNLLSDKAYADLYSKFGESILTTHMQAGYGSLTFSDVGTIVSDMIASGKYAGDMSTQGPKLQNLEANLKNYASSLETLKDILGGPVSSIIDLLDSLTGQNALNLNSTKLHTIASGLRDTLAISGISIADFGKLSATTFGYGSIYGETQSMAVQSAMAAANILSIGNPNVALSNEDYANAMARYSSDLMASSTGNALYTGLHIYANANGLDVNSADTVKAYVRILQESAGGVGAGAFTLGNIRSVAAVDDKTWSNYSSSSITSSLRESVNFALPVLAEKVFSVSDDVLENALNKIRPSIRGRSDEQDIIDYITSSYKLSENDFVEGLSALQLDTALQGEMLDIAKSIATDKGRFLSLPIRVAENIFMSPDKMMNTFYSELFKQDPTIGSTASGLEGILQSIYNGRTSIADLTNAGYGIATARGLVDLANSDKPTNQQIKTALGLTGSELDANLNALSVFDRLLLTDHYNDGGNAMFKKRVADYIQEQYEKTIDPDKLELTEDIDLFAKASSELRSIYKVKYLEASDKTRQTAEYKNIYAMLMSSSSLQLADDIEMAKRLNIETSAIDDILINGTRERDMIDTAKRINHVYNISGEELSDNDLNRYVSIATKVLEADNDTADLMQEWFRSEKSSINRDLRGKLKDIDVTSEDVQFLESSKNLLSSSGADIFKTIKPLEEVNDNIFQVLAKILPLLQELVARPIMVAQ